MPSAEMRCGHRVDGVAPLPLLHRALQVPGGGHATGSAGGGRHLSWSVEVLFFEQFVGGWIEVAECVVGGYVLFCVYSWVWASAFMLIGVGYCVYISGYGPLVVCGCV